MNMNAVINQPRELTQVEKSLLEQQAIEFEKELELETTKAISQIQTGNEVRAYATREEFEVMLHSRLRAHTDKVSNQP